MYKSLYLIGTLLCLFDVVNRNSIMKLSTYIAEVYTISFWKNGGKALCSELNEVMEAIWLRDWQNVKYESSQVLLYLLILSHYALNKFFAYELIMELPSWLPWYEDYDRVVILKQILELSNAPNQKFDPEWMNRGNNWKKPEKVVYILGQAGLELSASQAQELINQVSVD
jgi:hypothetical protein